VTVNLRYCSAQNIYSDILELFCRTAFTNVVIHKQVQCGKGHMFPQNFKKICQRRFNFEVITQPVYGQTDRRSLTTGFRSSVVSRNPTTGDTNSLHREQFYLHFRHCLYPVYLSHRRCLAYFRKDSKISVSYPY
jgi:hypothetical protein